MELPFVKERGEAQIVPEGVSLTETPAAWYLYSRLGLTISVTRISKTVGITSIGVETYDKEAHEHETPNRGSFSLTSG